MIIIYFSENRDLCEMMGKCRVEPERTQMAVQKDACALHARQTRQEYRHTHKI